MPTVLGIVVPIAILCLGTFALCAIGYYVLASRPRHRFSELADGVLDIENDMQALALSQGDTPFRDAKDAVGILKKIVQKISALQHNLQKFDINLPGIPGGLSQEDAFRGIRKHFSFLRILMAKKDLKQAQELYKFEIVFKEQGAWIDLMHFFTL